MDYLASLQVAGPLRGVYAQSMACVQSEITGHLPFMEKQIEKPIDLRSKAVMDYVQQFKPATQFDYDTVMSTRDIMVALFQSNLDDAYDASEVESVMRDLGFTQLSVSSGPLWLMGTR